MELINAEELKTYFKNIANEWGDGYKDINLEELSESDKKIASTIAKFLINTIVVIDEFPTVDAEPVKHGHWIFGQTMGHSWMKCSECCVSQSGQTATFTYCSNCGAKMDEVTE